MKISSKSSESRKIAESSQAMNDCEPRNGYSFWTATVFIIGDVAGAGILSLPYAASQAGWSSLAMIIYAAICAGYSGVCLARSWLILEERYPDLYRADSLTRKPLAAIARHAYGPGMGHVISALMIVGRLGSTVVFLLLSANLLRSLMAPWFIGWSVCHWVPLLAAIIIIPLWLGSPADFWPIGYVTMLSTAVGTILLLASILAAIVYRGIALDLGEKNSVEDMAMAFGKVLYSFGGAAVFPTIQNDMRRKEQFPNCVSLGFFVLTLFYLPVTGIGYLAFGANILPNITDNLTSGAGITLVRLCFFVHCSAVIFVCINPAFLEFEELFQIPKQFNWKRSTIRTLVIFVVVFIAETSPNFGQIQNLIGAASTALLSFVFASLFYVKLCRDHSDPNWPDRRLSSLSYVALGFVIATGVIGGLLTAYSTLANWTPLSAACYISS